MLDSREDDAYQARLLHVGNGGQRVFVVPSHDLVIVRMGHARGGATADTNLRAAQSLILEAIQAPSVRR